MACQNIQIHGIQDDCLGSRGGIKTVYIAPWADDIYEISGSTVSGDTIVADVNSGVTWYEYQFRKNTGNMTQTLTVDNANGVSFVSTEVNLVFSRMENAKRLEMNALAVNKMAVVVVDSNNEWHALGVAEAVSAGSGTGETGTQKSDGNKYTMVLTDEYDLFPPFLSETARTTLKAHIYSPTQG